jgi:hypothetical protein
MVIYNEMEDQNYLSKVVFEKHAIHKPSTNEISIDLL